MTTIKLRRSTASEWSTANPILAEGEPGFEKDTGRYKIGDGVKTWNQLDYYLTGSLLSQLYVAKVETDIFAARGDVAQPIMSAMPRTMKKIAGSQATIPKTIKVYIQGSSIAVQGAVTSPLTDTPGALLVQELKNALNAISNVTVTSTNDGVNGSVVAGLLGGDDCLTKYNAYVAANGVPDIYFGVWGMNDFTAYNWHQGQTFGIPQSDGGSPYTFWGRMEVLLAKLRADGVDIINSTTPHRYPDRVRSQIPSGYGLSAAQIANGIIYPNSGSPSYTPAYKPDGSNTSDQAHTKMITLPNGGTVEIDVRYWQGNQAIRAMTAAVGGVVLDAETPFLEAVAKNGWASMFPADNVTYNHPSTLGIAMSYGRAAKALGRALRTAFLHASPIPSPIAVAGSSVVIKKKVDNATRTTTARSTDAQLTLPVLAGEKWTARYVIDYSTPEAADLAIGFAVPAGTTGFLRVMGMGDTDTTGISGLATSRRGPLEGNWMLVGGNQSDATAYVEIDFTVGSTAGNVDIQFGQGAASGTTTIYLSSKMKAEKLS